MHKTQGGVFPCDSGAGESLAQEVNDFFIEKIHLIREKLVQNMETVTPSVSVQFQSFSDGKSACDKLSQFAALSDNNVAKILASRPSKHSALDPIPTWLVKDNISKLLPLITAIINSSFGSGEFPRLYKCAALKPLLKKIGLDAMIFKNLRPISNLAFISKVLECAACNQYKSHLEEHGLHEVFQSAYKENHSVETAVLCVHDDIMRALDQKKSVVLVMLDLSAAFDTVDHTILLDLLEKRMGVSGLALKWFQSYLSGRSQYVTINGKSSNSSQLTCGVPQGSVLGPVLFTTYMLALGDILRQLQTKFHCYADDQELYIEFFVDESVTGNLETSLSTVLAWLNKNFMSCNTDKTDMIIISPPQGPTPATFTINFSGDTIIPTKQVRNLGAIFDKNMKMEAHVNKRCQVAYQHLRNIAQIRHCLNRQSCETLIHAFVTSRLDFMNAILYGLPETLIAKLQRVQNAAARLLCGVQKFEHITPTLKSLHWLPIKQRIRYKICVLVFKCINGTAPTYLNDKLVKYIPSRSLRSSKDNKMLQVPKVRTRLGERGFSYNAPKLWNELPYHIRSSGTIETFKRNLKAHLYNIAYP